MKKMEIKAVLEPLLAARLAPLDEGDLGNGTPLSAAVATVIAIDMASKGARVAREAESRVAELTDEQLTAAIDGFRECLANRNTQISHTLPYGTIMGASYQAGVKIGPHYYLPLRGIPGVHERGTPGLPAAPGKELLRQEIHRAMAALPATDVPVPGIDDIVVVNRWRWRDAVRVPMRGGPGVTFVSEQHIPLAETMLDIDIALHAATIANAARMIISQSKQVDVEYKLVVTAIQPLLDRAQREGLHFVFTGINIDKAHGRMNAIPKFETLGHDLRPETWEAPTYGSKDLVKTITNQLRVQRRRKRVMEDARRAGARGRVDEVTLRAIDALSDDPAATLRQMAGRKNVTIQGGRRGTKSDPVRLAWKNGRVESSFTITDKASWNYGRLIIKNVELPDTVVDTLPGKPISALVEHPFLDGAHTIRSITGRGRGWLFVNLDLAWTVFDEATGERIETTARQVGGNDDGDKTPTAPEKQAQADGPRQGDMLAMMG